MSFFKTLFGGQPAQPAMRMLPGFVASIPMDVVRNLDIGSVSEHLGTLIEMSSKHGRRWCVELTFDGFDSDPRAIEQIPEIVAWCKRVHQEHPEFMQWLTPGALLRYLMCVIPGFSSRLPDGRVELSLDSEDMRLAIGTAAMVAHTRLQEAGAQPDQIMKLTLEAAENLQAALKGQRLGHDYGVSLP